jgi:hypothetical protein
MRLGLSVRELFLKLLKIYFDFGDLNLTVDNLLLNLMSDHANQIGLIFLRFWSGNNRFVLTEVVLFFVILISRDLVSYRFGHCAQR